MIAPIDVATLIPDCTSMILFGFGLGSIIFFLGFGINSVIQLFINITNY